MITLPKRTLLLWQLRATALAVITAVIIILFAPLTAWMYLPFGIVVVLALGAVFVYLPFYLKCYKIILGDDAIIVSKGIFIRTTKIMPYPRLVYAQSFSTPLSALFHLKGVALKAARGIIIIPEMHRDDAARLLGCVSEETK